MSSGTSLGVPGRMMVAGLSLLIAAPCYLVLYNASYPLCFVGLAFGGFFGEMYYGLAMAVLAEMVPKRLFIVLTSVYISLLIGAGSNATLSVPFLRDHFDARNELHTFEVEAAPTYTYANSEIYNGDGTEMFTVTESGSLGLTQALSVILASTYGVAGLIFLFSVPMIRNDMKYINTQEGGPTED